VRHPRSHARRSHGRWATRATAAGALALTALLGAAAPARADIVDPKSKTDISAFLVRFRADVVVEDDDDLDGVDRTTLTFPNHLLVRQGELFVIALVSACAGDEVRFESQVFGRFEGETLKVSARSDLFEGTDCETHDHDGRTSTTTTVATPAYTGGSEPVLTTTATNTDEGEPGDFGRLTIQFAERRRVSFEASDAPAVEVAGMVEVTDYEPILENERNWVMFWARVIQRASLTLTTCAGDNTEVDAEVIVDPARAPAVAAVTRGLVLEAADSCGKSGTMDTTSRTETVPLTPSFETLPMLVAGARSDEATITLSHRLIEYGGPHSGGGLTDVSGLVTIAGRRA
jgi:hypothetical protein